MGLFNKEFAYVFMNIAPVDGRLTYNANGYVVSKRSFIKNDGKMDVDILSSIWDEGKKAFPGIETTPEKWVFYGEIVKGAVTFTETICREATAGGGIWKRANSKDVMGGNSLKAQISDLRKMQN